jgi:DNA-binding HxlR family transcriptional regulator
VSVAIAKRAGSIRKLTVEGHDCAVERALSVVGAKWTLLIIHHLTNGPRRFGELLREIDGTSPKMLTARLRELERLGLVTRTAYLEVPPRVEYSLTRVGRGVWPIVNALDRWGRTLKA